MKSKRKSVEPIGGVYPRAFEIPEPALLVIN
jgi:hypothetical protein